MYVCGGHSNPHRGLGGVKEPLGTVRVLQGHDEQRGLDAAGVASGELWKIRSH